jgi:signal transduction histidine kinase
VARVLRREGMAVDVLLVLATSERGLDRRESVDLSELAGDVLRAAEPKARQHNLVVAAEIRPARVTGDPSLVVRMVANLVDNAMSYNVAGGRIEVATGTEGGRAFLSVANTGPLVPPETVELLLSPFERLDRTAADDGHHGLGLSIVESIAAAHSADLTLRAQPAGGLGIRVLFPVEEAG